MIPSKVLVDVAGVSRDLPVRQVSPGVYLGILLLACDPELTEAAGCALAARLPSDAQVLVMPDGKAQALLHVVQRESGLPAVLVRKERKSYLVEPVLEVTATSVTTKRQHAFYLGGDDAAALRGRRVVLLDDVVSSGGTISALEELVRRCGASVACVAAVATEGALRADVVSLLHLTVYTC